MTLELEIINLYELVQEVRRLNGVVLDVNTDCIVCTFFKNQPPFTIDQDGNIEGYYYDNEKKVPKYKLEKDCERLKHAQLPKWVRSDTYPYKEPEWNITTDPGHNDFQPTA